MRILVLLLFCTLSFSKVEASSFLENQIDSIPPIKKGLDIGLGGPTPNNQPPHFYNIPDQVISHGELFPKVDLNDYLFEPNGDSILWSYRFQANLITMKHQIGL